MTASSPYPAGTVERWAWEYVVTDALDHKRAPPPPPRDLAAPALSPLRLAAPGRPPELRVTSRARKSPGPEAIRAPARRAELIHTFLHHELQAAELMCWAILAFPDTPEAFRLGLLGVARDEIRHMALYEEQLAALGHGYGSFPVRDWFWERVPRVQTPLGFVATFGMGLEGANLDHTARFAERFRAIGDEAGAALQERIGAEEVPHVRFALRWFERWTGSPAPSLARWARELPPPLSPLLMRGAPLDRAARLEAGLSPTFVDELGSMVARAWILNLDAEVELADPSAHTPSRAVAARTLGHVERLGALLGPGDVLLDAGTPAGGLPGRAWCPTPRALAALARAGARVPAAPPVEVIRRVNHRRFAADLGQTLDGARYVASRAELAETLAARAGLFLLKRPFGFAGRGRLRLAAGAVGPAEERWIEASLATGEGLQVEPWVERAGDFALHGHLSAAGEVTLGEPTVQRCTPAGAWVESARAPAGALSAAERAALLAATEEAAAALSAAGYFGPFGVDAFRYRDARGVLRWNPRCEINARYSMGWAAGMGDRRPDS